MVSADRGVGGGECEGIPPPRGPSSHRSEPEPECAPPPRHPSLPSLGNSSASTSTPMHVVFAQQRHHQNQQANSNHHQQVQQRRRSSTAWVKRRSSLASQLESIPDEEGCNWGGAAAAEVAASCHDSLSESFTDLFDENADEHSSAYCEHEHEHDDRDESDAASLSFSFASGLEPRGDYSGLPQLAKQNSMYSAPSSLPTSPFAAAHLAAPRRPSASMLGAAAQTKRRRSSLLSIPDDIELLDKSLIRPSFDLGDSLDNIAGNDHIDGLLPTRTKKSMVTKEKKKPKHTFCICDQASYSESESDYETDGDSNSYPDDRSVTSPLSASTAGGRIYPPEGELSQLRRRRRSQGTSASSTQQHGQQPATVRRRNSLFTAAPPTQQQEQQPKTARRRNSLFYRGSSAVHSDDVRSITSSKGPTTVRRRNSLFTEAPPKQQQEQQPKTARRRNSLFYRWSSTVHSDDARSIASSKGGVRGSKDWSRGKAPRSDIRTKENDVRVEDRADAASRSKAHREGSTTIEHKNGITAASNPFGTCQVGPVACPASQRARVQEPTGVELWKVFYATVERSSDQGTTGVNVLLKRTTYLTYLFLTIVVAFVYAIMYALILGELIAAVLALAYVAVAGISIEATVRYELWGYSTVLLKVLVVNPFLVQFAIGGILSSGAVMMWGLLSPVGAALILDPKCARGYLLAFVINVTNASLFELFAPYVPEADRMPPRDVFVFWCHYVVFGTIVMATASIFASQFETEQSHSEGLLLNILPAPIAKRLKRGENPIVDHYDSVTILFAGLIGFSDASSELPPSFLIGTVLKDIFVAFDDLVERRKLEKIKTIGDAYMVVGGLNADESDEGPDLNWAQSAVLLGLEFQDAVREVNRRHGTDLDLRVGVHTGPVIAGVLGVDKFAFDVWGDAVNTASRMESHGVPGLVHVSLDTYGQICMSEGRLFECRRGMESIIKGKGVMTTFLVSHPRRRPDELNISTRTLRSENLSSVSRETDVSEGNAADGNIPAITNCTFHPDLVDTKTLEMDDSAPAITAMHDSGSTQAAREDDVSHQSSTGKLWIERAQGIANKVDNTKPSPLARFIKKYPKANTGTVWHKLAVRISCPDSPPSTIMKREALVCFWLLSLFVGAVSTLVFYCIDDVASATLAVAYITFTGVATMFAIRFRSFEVFETAQMLGLLLSTLIGPSFLYGGVCKFGNGIVWMFLFPLASATFHSPRKAQVWYLVYVVTTCIGYSFDASYINGYLSRAQAVQFAMNNIGPLTVIFTAFHLYATEIKKEYSYSETLLRNTLPEAIAHRLRNGENPIVDNFESVSILFADLVGFTQASSEMCPSFLIGVFLRDIFFEFDKLVKARGLEKVKTIGDAYMVVGGLEGSSSSTHHAYQMVMLGTELIDALRTVNKRLGTNFQVRVGIHTGPAIAGVLGVKKFAYDVWGDAVTIASRMESHGTPGMIQVSSSTYELIRDLGCFECRNGRESMIKGRGTMRTHLITGRKGAGKAV